jgi:hypothetical protein
MRFQAASLCLVMMSTSIAPALAQEATPAAPSATVAEPEAPVEDLVEDVLAAEGGFPEPAATDAPVTPEVSPASTAPPTKRARKTKKAPKAEQAESAPIAPIREQATWSTPEPMPETRRRSPGMLGGGIVMTVLGGAGMVGGLLGVIAGGMSSSDATQAAGTVGIVGGLVSVGIGIPLIVVGGKTVAADGSPLPPRAPRRDSAASSAWATPNTERRSPAMIGVGTVLTVGGGITTLVAVRELISGEDGTAGALLVGSAVGLGVGIPLIAVGAKKVPVDAAAPVPQAQLRVGPGSVDFSMEL